MPFLIGNAEQLADHRDWHGYREALDYIGGRSFPLHAVQRFVDNLFYPRLELLDLPHGERSRHHAPYTGVLRRVHGEQVSGPQRKRRYAGSIRLGRLERAKPRIGQELLELWVAGDEPRVAAVGHPYPGNWLATAQLRVSRMEI